MSVALKSIARKHRSPNASLRSNNSFYLIWINLTNKHQIQGYLMWHRLIVIHDLCEKAQHQQAEYSHSFISDRVWIVSHG